MNLLTMSICLASGVAGAMPSKSESLGPVSSLGICPSLISDGAGGGGGFVGCCAAPNEENSRTITPDFLIAARRRDVGTMLLNKSQPVFWNPSVGRHF